MKQTLADCHMLKLKPRLSAPVSLQYSTILQLILVLGEILTN